ncbi:MAG TPA: CrcB family protein [Vicinamibacterales bacterium]
MAVAFGGAVGSLMRHAVNIAFARLAATPYATATVNIVGSVVIGVLAGLTASGRLHLSPPARAFIFVGILGGFTTFSSFMLDTLTLQRGSQQGLAAVNVFLQVLIGLLAVFGGYAAAR